MLPREEQRQSSLGSPQAPAERLGVWDKDLGNISQVRWLMSESLRPTALIPCDLGYLSDVCICMWPRGGQSPGIPLSAQDFHREESRPQASSSREGCSRAKQPPVVWVGKPLLVFENIHCL